MLFAAVLLNEVFRLDLVEVALPVSIIFEPNSADNIHYIDIVCALL